MEKIGWFSGDCKDRLNYLISMLIASFILAVITISVGLICCLYDKSSFGSWKLVMLLVYTLLAISIFLFIAILLSFITVRKVRFRVSFAGLFASVLIPCIMFATIHFNVILSSSTDIKAEPSCACTQVSVDPFVVIFALLLLAFDLFVIIKLGIIAKKENLKEE